HRRGPADPRDLPAGERRQGGQHLPDGQPGEAGEHVTRGRAGRVRRGMTTHVTVVGGGLAGLTAAIACAEKGARVTLYEAHRTLGGRARSTEAPYVANDGTHAFYADGGRPGRRRGSWAC